MPGRYLPADGRAGGEVIFTGASWRNSDDASGCRDRRAVSRPPNPHDALMAVVLDVFSRASARRRIHSLRMLPALAAGPGALGGFASAFLSNSALKNALNGGLGGLAGAALSAAITEALRAENDCGCGK